MAALSAATAIVAVVVPFAAGLSLLGTVPMGLLAYRYRLRVLIAATIAGSLIAFLVAGMGGMMTVVECAYIGGLIGLVKRRNRGTPTVIVVGVCAGVAFGAVSVGALIGAGAAAESDLRVNDGERQRPGARAVPSAVYAAGLRAHERRLPEAADVLAVADRRIIRAGHPDRHPDRMVGAVARAHQAVEALQPPEAGHPRRHRRDRPASGAVARRYVPLSQRRP